MKRQDISIPSPCTSSPFEDVADKDPTRYCQSCDERVHNLSAMTRRQARRFIAESDDPCVRYLYREDTNEVLFRDSEFVTRHRSAKVQLQSQRRGVRRLLQAAAVAVPLLIAGCDDDPANAETVEAQATAPATSGETGDEAGDGVPGAAKVPFEPTVDMEAATEEGSSEAETIADRVDAQSRDLAELLDEQAEEDDYEQRPVPDEPIQIDDVQQVAGDMTAPPNPGDGTGDDDIGLF